MVAQLELRVGGKEKRFVHMCVHPVSAHKKGCRYVIPCQHIYDALIEPGRQLRLLAEIKGQRDIRFVAVAMTNKVDIGMR